MKNLYMPNSNEIIKTVIENIVDRQVISKKDLCLLLGIPRSGYNTRGRTLRNRYITNEVLQEMNCSEEYYKRIRVFDKLQTKVIIDKLKLAKHYPNLSILIIPY